jgi:hypothetical protein
VASKLDYSSQLRLIVILILDVVANVYKINCNDRVMTRMYAYMFTVGNDSHYDNVIVSIPGHECSAILPIINCSINKIN